MGKKVKEYKAGDFIFAKVKGYPAWPARIQRPNGKKYFVYFYGTGETANLPPNQIFDYVENKDKFLTKTIKRKDFNDGARQIEHDFANNVPLEEVIGVPVDGAEEPMDTSANDTANDSAVSDSALDTTADAAETTTADDTNTTQNDAAVEDSDEGALIIDEGKKGRKSIAKPPATPKPAKEAKTPRGKPKKEDTSAKEKEDAQEGDEKKEEELVSRSGRKIRPKRYIDEQTEENATLPSPATKKRRGVSPAAEKEKEKPEKNKKTDSMPAEKTSKHYKAVSLVELEDLKEPFQTGEKSNENATNENKLFVPVFGKKLKNAPNKTRKPKFQPPIKVPNVKNKFTPPVKLTQGDEIPDKNDHKEFKIPSSSEKIVEECQLERIITSNMEPSYQEYQETVNVIQNSIEKVSENQYSPIDSGFMQQRTQHNQENIENCQETLASTQNTTSLKSQRSFSLGNIILGSLNLINDEDIILSQHSDKNSVQSLSHDKNIESFCSVASLEKTYKNLDMKSFENAIPFSENAQIEGITREIPQNEVNPSERTQNLVPLEVFQHNIPFGEDYLKLFQDFKVPRDKKENYAAMSILFGDMGPNRLYADYVKENMGLVTDNTEEEDDKEPILIAYLPSGQYAGIKLFQHRPMNFKNDAARLQWDRQAAAGRITLKQQLEKGHITAQSVITQLEMDLNLTDEEKANLDKEREIEEKKSRVQFLKTEMKLIELDAKIKSCLSLEKADTDLCLKLLDELMELDIKCLMLLKHPTCLETVKRMRAYVGNTPSWEMSESDALQFSKQASLIRRRADAAYRKLKDLFAPPEGLSFWEFFSERVVVFKKCTAHLSGDERLEMIHEPLEMTMPTSHTMKASIEAANEEVPPELDDSPPKKLKATPAKSKKAAANSTPAKAPAKRQSSRSKAAEASKEESKTEEPTDKTGEAEKPTEQKAKDKESEKEQTEQKEPEELVKDTSEPVKVASEPAKDASKPVNEASEPVNEASEPAKAASEPVKDDSEPVKDTPETVNDTPEPTKETKKPQEKEDGDSEKPTQNDEKEQNSTEKNGDEPQKGKADEATIKEDTKKGKEDEVEKKVEKDAEKDKKAEKAEKEKEDAVEPRAKRVRESNRKTEPPPPKSPGKRKSRS